MSLPITKNSFTFTWNIVNVSLCNLKDNQGFFSPPIKSEALVNTVWYLKFTPVAGENGELSVEVARRCLGRPTFNSLDYDLSFMAVDGTVLPALKIVDAIKTEVYLYENLFLQRSKIVGNKKSNILYQDALSVRFRIWTQSMEPGYCFARTFLGKMKFPWNVKKTPTVKTARVSKVFKLPTLHFTVILEEFNSYYDYLNMRFNIFTSKGKFEGSANCKISVVDPNDKEHKVLFDFYACSGEASFGFQIRTKPDYLVDDMLSLQWHFTYGINKIVSEEAQKASDGSACQTGPASVLFKNTNVICTTLQEDLFQFYREPKFSDVTLVAGGIPFSVHKNILCARSKVFCNLFGTRGQTKFPFYRGYIDCTKQEVFYINNIQADTLDRMLFYVYTDIIHAMQWTCMSRLYDAACKYEIRGLKQKCQTVLKSELSVSNVCRILSLADAHQDKDLVKCARNFISEHEEVVGSKE